MSEVFPVVYVARHGETTWSLSGQHTGRTDLPLTPRGERNAKRLGERLKGISFSRVFTSPLQRASRTCALAKFGAVAESDHDLVEWNYGEYEGRTSAQIHTESPKLGPVPRRVPPTASRLRQVGEQADRVVQRIRAVRWGMCCSFQVDIEIMFPSIPGENVESKN